MEFTIFITMAQYRFIRLESDFGRDFVLRCTDRDPDQIVLVYLDPFLMFSPESSPSLRIFLRPIVSADGINEVVYKPCIG